MRAPLLLALLGMLLASPAHGDECMPVEALICMPEDALAYDLGPVPRVDGYGGYHLTIHGQQGGPNQAGGRVYIRGGAAGPGDVGGVGGDVHVVGGAPNASGVGGDVILECDPAATSGCGIDVGFGANVLAVLLGHEPAGPSDLSGRLSMFGRVKTAITFDKDVGGKLTCDPPASPGATGQAVAVVGAPGAAANDAVVGGKGGAGKALGGPGGAGSATRASGQGGDAWLTAGSAGANGGGGLGTGGSANIEVGGGAAAGALNLGSSGPAPVAVNIGQAGVPINVLGWLPERRSMAVVTAPFTTPWPAKTDVVLEQGFTGTRAIYLPAPSLLGLPAGKSAHLVVKVDGSVAGYTLYIYPPGGGVTIDGSTAAVVVTDPWAVRRFFTDGTSWFSE